MKTFVIGDIHGGYKALLQCIEQSKIDKENDCLICIGDVVDGWSYVPECVEELLSFKNLVAIRGNHDQWFMDWYNTGKVNEGWYRQGGKATLRRYEHDMDLAKEHMEKYFNKTVIYFIDTHRGYAFMHGGYDWTKSLVEDDSNNIMWDRDMIKFAQMYPLALEDTFKEFNKIFIGHTTTEAAFTYRYTRSLLPAIFTKLVNVDTGGGWSGKLTIMDVDTLQFWQSDLVMDLYPNEFNR